MEKKAGASVPCRKRTENDIQLLLLILGRLMSESQRTAVYLRKTDPLTIAEDFNTARCEAVVSGSDDLC